PFKSLSFDENRAEQIWGINFSRRIRRKNEVVFWSPIPRRYENFRLSQAAISRLSLAGQLRGLEEVRRGRNLKVKPFVVGDLSKFAAQDHVISKFKPGIDTKYNVTPSLTLDLTMNTDFSQVEVDEQQVNLTRFPLFFPEKREFFLENEGIFQFGDIPLERGPDRSKETQLFFSRRIGLSAEGEPIPIWGGMRLSGQIGKFSLGLLDMQTKSHNGKPGNNFAVVRLKRNILANSDIGAILINRQASQGKDFNRALGADANFRFGENFTVNGYLAKTKADGISDRDLAKKVTVQWRDNLTRFQVVYTDLQENFNPEVGFTQRTGVRYFRSRNELHLRPLKNHFIREFHPHFLITYHMDETNRTLTKDSHYALEILFQNGGRLDFDYDPQFDRLNRPFRLRRQPLRPEITIPAGDYHFAFWSLKLESDASKKLVGNFALDKGSYYSGERTTLKLFGTFRPTYRFSVEPTYSMNKVSLENVTVDGVSGQSASFTTHLLSSRISYYFSTRMSLIAFLQYNSDRKQVTSNIRFNFIHRPLSDLFLVYNEQRDVSGAGQTDRGFALKYTHMISF
ncbi:MAG: hypothetical protein HY647_09835, partial [Acidobacteria bacterium]|nr:hypothetical protein [Acidobacteriota bacterium]